MPTSEASADITSALTAAALPKRESSHVDPALAELGARVLQHYQYPLHRTRVLLQYHNHGIPPETPL